VSELSNRKQKQRERLQKRRWAEEEAVGWGGQGQRWQRWQVCAIM